MAFIISDNGEITMFRGDSIEFAVPLMTVDGNGDMTGVYEMQPGDTLTMTVRTEPLDDSAIEFSVVSEDNKIRILPEHTANMAPGRYSADIQLNSGLSVHTVWPDLSKLNSSQISRGRAWNNFILAGEVTIP